MYKIELGISTAMSLHAFSSAGSDDDIEEIDEDIDDDIGEDDVADVILSTSDEDFEKLSPEDFEEALSGESLGDENEEEEDSDSANEEDPTPTAEGDGSEQAEEDDDSEGDQPNENTENQPVSDQAYNEAFQLLYGKPIKASGREVQLRNAEHARNFIEMGIDYNKKMHSMKPHLRTLKTLEKEGLLDAGKEDRLNLLLEIEKGNKDALKRLIAESDIDPLDLADEDVIEAGRNYKPQNHLMSDREVEIEEALNSIEGSPSQQRTLDVMTKEFDTRSRQLISENPRYIVALNDDIASGVYDDVMEAVQYKKDMRQVAPGVSDMELYIQTVQEISNMQAPEQPNVQSEQTKPNKKRSGSSRSQKQAMGGSRSSNKSKQREYDPMEILGMDDDKFMKEMGMDSL